MDVRILSCTRSTSNKNTGKRTKQIPVLVDYWIKQVSVLAGFWMKQVSVLGFLGILGVS